jgi:hypothetical protein
MNWTNLAQDRDRWLAKVNSVMNIYAALNTRNVLTIYE